MGGQIDGYYMNRWMDEWMHGKLSGWKKIDKWVFGEIDGWINNWIGG